METPPNLQLYDLGLVASINGTDRRPVRGLKAGRKGLRRCGPPH